MHCALRCLTVAMLALVALPVAAHAANVDRDQSSDILSIVDNAGVDDDILEERTSMFDIISDHSATATMTMSTTADDVCTLDADADVVTCPRSSSLAVDLGDGDDR